MHRMALYPRVFLPLGETTLDRLRLLNDPARKHNYRPSGASASFRACSAVVTTLE